MTLAHASMPDIEAAIMDKNYEQARTLSSNVLKSTADPKERIQAQYYLGLSQLRLGQYAEGRSAFQIVMSATGPGDLYDRAALGMMEGLYMPGFYKDALKAGERLLRKSPHSSLLSLIYLKLARTHLKLTHWSLAREYLQKIINEFPRSLEAPIAQNLMEEKEYFTVQVGSFLDQDRAERLMQQLKSGGQYAYIVETTTSDGKKFYRVRVGQMASLLDVQTLEAQLSHQGYPTLIYP
ncbi:MAG: SPOR domain-containing protein [Candidatus Omnitrophica bacterium]|nr:SPOR domain-containing protein [Candidatus Omnitrophota bacterium]